MLTTGLVAPLSLDPRRGASRTVVVAEEDTVDDVIAVPDKESLRRAAWAIGEEAAADSFLPSVNHVGLAMIAPYQGFAHWRLLHGWIEETRRQRGDAWNGSRMIVRIYDVS